MSGIAKSMLFRKSRVFLPLFLVIAALMPLSSHAQDLEPRAYSNIPVGLNFILQGYGYTQGGVAVDASVPLTDADIRAHTAFVAYARSLDVLGMSGKFDVVAPYSWLSGEAAFAGQPVKREVSGFNDPRFRLSVNFYGAPALSMAEFADYKQNVLIGASLQVSVPLGQYDSSKAVNIGTNRWFVKPELGISKAWGPLTLELAPSVTFYSTNNDFLGGMKREQDPLYSVQGHLVYSFSRSIWAAIDATYSTGGRTTIDGFENDDKLSNWRLGATLSLPVDRHHSMKLYASTGVAVRTGGDFDAIGIVWQYRWGDGL